MPVQITINGDDAKHALAELGGLAGGLIAAKGVATSEMSDVSDAGPVITGEKPAETTGEPARRTRKPKDKPEVAAPTEPQQAIQTGGEREPQPEPEKQPEKAPLTLDSVRSAAKDYITKFGMDAAQVDLQFTLDDVCGVKAISQLEGANQETLQKAIDAFAAAGAADSRYVSKKQGAL